MMSWKAGTAAILVLMVVTYAVVGGVMGYVLTFWAGGTGWTYGVAIFLLLALAAAVYSYLVPIPTVLKGYNAREVSARDEPRLYGIVRDLAAKADTPMPRVFVCDVPFPNAFALGRTPDRALVAATRPLMDLLDDDELAGVMAHELSHVVHRDTVVNTTARTCAKVLSVSALVMGGIAMGGSALMGAGGGKSGGGGILILILVLLLIPVVIACAIMCLALPSAGAVMRFGVSRSREYGADEGAARLTGRPLALADALLKMERVCSAESNGFRDSASANLWIVNPFGRFRKRMLNSLMDTHPSTESRVARLRELDREING